MVLSLGEWCLSPGRFSFPFLMCLWVQLVQNSVAFHPESRSRPLDLWKLGWDPCEGWEASASPSSALQGPRKEGQFIHYWQHLFEVASPELAKVKASFSCTTPFSHHFLQFPTHADVIMLVCFISLHILSVIICVILSLSFPFVFAHEMMFSCLPCYRIQCAWCTVFESVFVGVLWGCECTFLREDLSFFLPENIWAISMGMTLNQGQGLGFPCDPRL